MNKQAKKALNAGVKAAKDNPDAIRKAAAAAAKNDALRGAALNAARDNPDIALDMARAAM